MLIGSRCVTVGQDDSVLRLVGLLDDTVQEPGGLSNEGISLAI